MQLSRPGTEQWTLDRIVPDPAELARHGDPEKIRQLAEDMQANGQLQPAGVTEDGRLIFGHGRFLGKKLTGGTLEVKVYPAALTRGQFALIRLAENLHREELTEPQAYTKCKELLALNPDWKKKDLAAAVHKDGAWVTRLLSVDECIPEVRQNFLDGMLGLTHVYAIARSPDQLATLALKLGGATRDELEAHARKARVSSKPAVRQSRCKLTLPNVTVTVSGASMDVERLIEILQSALDASRRASKDQLDIRTLERVLKDKAKGAGHAR